MKYHIKMSNGDNAEADTLAGILLAGKTLYEDVGGNIAVNIVKVNGRIEKWATQACRAYIKEESTEAKVNI